MSTRWYPIYQRGNPQLRVFLPNFWMKLIRPTEEQPPNVVTFSVSMEMTKYDVRSYLEKIYKLPVVDVRTRIALGETKKDQAYGYITKKDDVKLAYVTLVWAFTMSYFKRLLLIIPAFSSRGKSPLSSPISLRKRLKDRPRRKSRWMNRKKASADFWTGTRSDPALQAGFPFSLVICSSSSFVVSTG